MTMTPVAKLLCPLALVALSACGGGGGGGGTEPDLPAFADPAATGTTALTAASLDSAARSTSGLSGTLNHDADTFSIGTLSGGINAARTQVVLDGGGQVTLTPGDTAFAVTFEAVPVGADRTIGVVGVATPAAEMPGTGAVTYTGTSQVTLQDGTSLFELTGDASVVARFGEGTVATTVSGLSGTQTTGLAAPVAVTDVATIGFTGSTISGTTFSGGTPTVTSGSVAGLSGAEASSLDGAFYGPGATEVGAVFVIDDSASGSLTGFGVVLAQ